MSYKTAGIIVIALALVGIGGRTVWVLSNPDESSSPTTVASLERKAHNPKPNCFAVQDNPHLQVPLKDQNYLKWAAVDHILDVPAGTKVTVFLKAYDGKTATGSSVYEGGYGAYNFTAKTVGDTSGGPQGNWAITSFESCKS